MIQESTFKEQQVVCITLYSTLINASISHTKQPHSVITIKRVVSTIYSKERLHPLYTCGFFHYVLPDIDN